MSPPPGSGLKDLIDEARRRHDDTRPEMLRALVGLYLQQPVHGDAEQARFATLARRLIDSVDVSVAAKHVRQIANRADLPRQFVLHLARGPLAVAGPVLRLSPVLGDADLIDLARDAGADHRAAIAARRDVSPELAKQLAALIDSPTPAPLASSETDATATDAAPGWEAAETAISAGPMAEDQDAWVTASEPPATGGLMVAEPGAPGVGEPAEVEPVEPTAEPEAAAPENPTTASAAPAPVPAEAQPHEPAPPAQTPRAEAHLAKAPPAEAPIGETPASKTPPQDAAPRNDTPAAGAAPAANLGFFTASPEERATLIARLLTLPPLALAERVAPPADNFTDALLEAGKADDRETLTTLLAGVLELRPTTAAAIVADDSGQAFAVAARVLGLSLAILSRLLFRLHPATGRSASEMTRLAQFFDSLPVMSAQHLVAQWRGERRATRERAEDAPPIRSYGVPRPVTHAAAETTDGRQRG